MNPIAKIKIKYSNVEKTHHIEYPCLFKLKKVLLFWNKRSKLNRETEIINTNCNNVVTYRYKLLKEEIDKAIKFLKDHPE